MMIEDFYRVEFHNLLNYLYRINVHQFEKLKFLFYESIIVFNIIFMKFFKNIIHRDRVHEQRAYFKFRSLFYQ